MMFTINQIKKFYPDVSHGSIHFWIKQGWLSCQKEFVNVRHHVFFDRKELLHTGVLRVMSNLGLLRRARNLIFEPPGVGSSFRISDVHKFYKLYEDYAYELGFSVDMSVTRIDRPVDLRSKQAEEIITVKTVPYYYVDLMNIEFLGSVMTMLQQEVTAFINVMQIYKVQQVILSR